MADVVKSIRQFLLGKTAVTDLVGQRIYQGRLPQTTVTLPAATLRIISETYDHALDGLSGLVYTRVQVECYGSTSESSRNVADTIIWCGVSEMKGTYTSVNIRGVSVEDGRREFEDEDSSGDDQRHVTSFDLMVVFLRT